MKLVANSLQPINTRWERRLITMEKIKPFDQAEHDSLKVPSFFSSSLALSMLFLNIACYLFTCAYLLVYSLKISVKQRLHMKVLRVLQWMTRTGDSTTSMGNARRKGLPKSNASSTRKRRKSRRSSKST